MAQKAKDTPMMKQYLEIKAQYEDAFLFYRVGDFYELFYEDAKKAAQILELTLTCRNKNAEDAIPMCGVPHHSAQGYIDTLVNLGYKVAICEQVEDPKATKPNQMVKREVIQLITPGTNVDINQAEGKENNYLVALYPHDDQYSLAYVDLSTGELKVTTVDEETAVSECTSLQTKEILCLAPLPEEMRNILKQRLNVLFSTQELAMDIEEELVGNLENDAEKVTVSSLYQYLVQTQKRALSHLQVAKHYEISNYLKMDYDSKFNLELTRSIRGNKRQGTLLWLLDETKTAMGGRLLKQWIERPIINETEIIQRQDRVQTLLDNFFERAEIQEKLQQVYDLERLVGKVSFGTANARDLIQLKTSLQQIPALKEAITKLDLSVWQRILDNMLLLDDLVDLIERAIKEDAGLSITEGNIIKTGYNKQLDEYLEAMHNSKQWLAKLEQDERQKTGISKLKVGYHRAFGYYLEVTKSMINRVPERYERKQTLTNSERFTTPELKEMERVILEAEDKSKELEYQLFVEIREQIKAQTAKLQKLAQMVATIDVLQSFATISEQYGYVRPKLNQQHEIKIIAGRHPVVEKVIGKQEYVANDVIMSQKTDLLLITGPNMSGKSTYMREVGLIVILTQMGCFVPCQEASLPIFDQIFTRIGASDNLISGQSTFMVEMMEANNALQYATENSLILFDELGRGTATYDGMALAQSIIEYISNHIHAKTLFSTHYHELTSLEETITSLKNIHVKAIEKDGEIIFMHKIQDGPADKSYGVHVAKIAGLPADLITRAETLLQQFEAQAVNVSATQTVENEVIKEELVAEDNVQLSLFTETNPLQQKLQELDLMNMTPMEAFNKLYELQQEFK